MEAPCKKLYNHNYDVLTMSSVREQIIIIPKTVNDEGIDKQWFKDIKKEISNGFGGYSIMEIEGGWVDSYGNSVEESSYYVIIAFDPDNYPLVDKFYTLAQKIKLDLVQNCVYVRFNDKVTSV